MYFRVCLSSRYPVMYYGFEIENSGVSVSCPRLILYHWNFCRPPGAGRGTIRDEHTAQTQSAYCDISLYLINYT